MARQAIDALRMGAQSEIARLVRVVEEAIVAVLVFGSAARNEHEEGSDLDILFVVDGLEAQNALLDEIHTGARLSVSPLVFTVDALLFEAAVRPSFVAHLLDEAVLIRPAPRWHDLVDHLRPVVADGEALERELQNRARAVESFAEVERFSNSPVTALSHLYTIARSLIVVRLLQQGVHEYSWRRAFDSYARLHPELRPQIEELKALRAYYEYARARRGAQLPKRSVQPSEMRSYVASIRRLAG